MNQELLNLPPVETKQFANFTDADSFIKANRGLITVLKFNAITQGNITNYLVTYIYANKSSNFKII